MNTIKRTSSGCGSGTILQDKYQLNHLLGRGSFAKVYHGTSLTDSSPVAIKVIDKSSSSADPTIEPRLMREVAAMRRLSRHPNILTLHEVMATKSKIYLIMELAPGGELFTKIHRRGRLSESAGRRYFQQLVSALHFCHTNGVAHRDLKPQNLLLDVKGNLKISDFGLSALPEQMMDGMLYTACGTPAYTAPEVVRRSGYDGAKADAWSCGIILFVLLAGALPFDDSNLGSMFKKIYLREFVFPDWISKAARNVIYKLLDPNPRSRMGMEGLMGMSWFRKKLKVDQDGGVGGEGIVVEEEEEKGEMMNAFDIISMSSGLDLSGLFEVEEGGRRREEARFCVRGCRGEVEERVRRVWGELGYRVEKGKGREMGLVKGKVVLVVKVYEVVRDMELLMLEIRVVSGGEGVDWEELRLGFGDVFVSWHNK